MPSSYAYDAENRLVAHVASGVTYTYDGDGKRVKKSDGKLYWPGLGLDAITESDLNGNITAEYVRVLQRQAGSHDRTERGAQP